jgi:ubiquinone/menaquinone biosynthesis C-methylase UbiE
VGRTCRQASAASGIRLEQLIGDHQVPTSVKKSENSLASYALGHTNAEHDRLIRQAARIAPVTERLFREAGISPGQRVLDLGSGVGDVAMLVFRIVGPSGEVVGIERDASSIERARARTAEAGFHNVSFTQTDVNQIVSDKPFDAAVGRFILMFLPDPVSVLRSVVRVVRPGGVVAFQEPSWTVMLSLGARLPLWFRARQLIHEILLRSGVNREMGLALYRVFQEVGLPAPKMHLEMPLGNDADFITLTSDLLRSLRPLAQQHKVSLKELGDLNTLPDRICAEVTAANTVVSLIAVVGAWSRKPINSSNLNQT